MSPPCRPKGEYRRAPPEGTPVSTDCTSQPAAASEAWHGLETHEAARQLGTDLQQGLSAGEAAGRLASGGPNRLVGA